MSLRRYCGQLARSRVVRVDPDVAQVLKKLGAQAALIYGVRPTPNNALRLLLQLSPPDSESAATQPDSLADEDGVKRP
jgi:hypothetical protein